MGQKPDPDGTRRVIAGLAGILGWLFYILFPQSYTVLAYVT